MSRHARLRRLRFPLLALGLIPLAAVAGETPRAPIVYIQAWVGALSTDDGSWKSSDVQTGESVLGDLGTLPFGGGVAQQLWGNGAWQIGYEGGGLVTWKNDSTAFRGTNTNLEVTVDNTFFSLGVFMGALVSVSPTQRVRLYVAAGPSVTWAWLQDDDNNHTATNNNTIDLSGTDSDVSAVAYARAGVEIVLGDGFTFGASVRYANDEFQFGNAGDLKFDKPLWLLTLGSRL